MEKAGAGIIVQETGGIVDYRKVVEESIGRKLDANEIIHHVDGDTHNNDLKNLEICTQKEHAQKEHPTNSDWEKAIERLISKDINITAKTLNKQLSVFFTERQKQIIFRKIYGLALSKTEAEYYSRAIKKKLVALGNPFVHMCAHSIVFDRNRID